MLKQMVIEMPKHPVVRYRLISEREVQLDFRGIRNPKSNLHGRRNPTQGNKRQFLSPEHLQTMIDEYYASCMGPMIDRYGNLVYDTNGHIVKTQVKPYTLSGLALYLGISTTQLKRYHKGMLDTILDEMKAETDDRLTFSAVVSRARQTVEAYAEGRLYDRDGQAGARYVLDSVFNWVTRKEQSDIDKANVDSELKRKEFELKQKILDLDSENTDLTINIVRGGKTHE